MTAHECPSSLTEWICVRRYTADGGTVIRSKLVLSSLCTRIVTGVRTVSKAVETWVWQHAPVSGNDLLLLLALADEANDDGCGCHPSIRRLAKKIRAHTDTVTTGVRRLEEVGELLVKRPERKGRGQFNRYVLVLGRNPDEVIHRLSHNWMEMSEDSAHSDPETRGLHPSPARLTPFTCAGQTRADSVLRTDPSTDPANSNSKQRPDRFLSGTGWITEAT